MNYHVMANWRGVILDVEPWVFDGRDVFDAIIVPLFGKAGARWADPAWFEQLRDLLLRREMQPSRLDYGRIVGVESESHPRDSHLRLFDVPLDVDPAYLREQVDRLVSDANRLASEGGQIIDHLAAADIRASRLDVLVAGLRIGGSVATVY